MLYLNTELCLKYHRKTRYNIYKKWMTIKHLTKPEPTAPLETEMLGVTPKRLSRQTGCEKLDEVAGLNRERLESEVIK
jgi:hypothetical protein